MQHFPAKCHMKILLKRNKEKRQGILVVLFYCTLDMKLVLSVFQFLKVDERCIRKFGRVITSAAPSAQNAVLNSQPGLVYAEEKSVKLAYIFRDDAQTVKVTYAM